MNVLIAGGSGFLGTALKNSLMKVDHNVFILTRRSPKDAHEFQWDGMTTNGWGHHIHEMEAVVNLTGFGLEHWPWTKRQKKRFLDSRVTPGLALVSAIRNATRRPRVFLQTSGINHYGLQGAGVADEATPPANDFLAQLTVKWEDATKPVEELGVRRVIARNAVVLARNDGLFPLMAFAPRLFLGGNLGDGKQAMPWIHVADQTNALHFLLENENAQGPFNLISPELTSNAKFIRVICKTMHRPYWFHVPKFLLRMILGEMSVLLTEGRYSLPKRLIESGFKFQFEKLENTMEDLLI